MLIIALVLALIGLVALVFAVVTSNEIVAWVCIGASVLGVILLIVDGIRERQQREAGDRDRDDQDDQDDQDGQAVDYPDDENSDADEDSAAAGDRAGDESSK